MIDTADLISFITTVSCKQSYLKIINNFKLTIQFSRWPVETPVLWTLIVRVELNPFQTTNEEKTKCQIDEICPFRGKNSTET